VKCWVNCPSVAGGNHSLWPGIHSRVGIRHPIVVVLKPEITRECRLWSKINTCFTSINTEVKVIQRLIGSGTTWYWRWYFKKSVKCCLVRSSLEYKTVFYRWVFKPTCARIFVLSVLVAKCVSVYNASIYRNVQVIPTFPLALILVHNIIIVQAICGDW
jgi:hypothetical protein